MGFPVVVFVVPCDTLSADNTDDDEVLDPERLLFLLVMVVVEEEARTPTRPPSRQRRGRMGNSAASLRILLLHQLDYSVLRLPKDPHC